MADFPRDWYDGEHLLPSDIFITEPPSKHDLLARRLSALTLLNQERLKTTYNFQRNPPCQNCLNHDKNGFKFVPKPVQPSEVDILLAIESRVLQKQMYQNHLREKLNRNRVLQNRLGDGRFGGSAKVSGGGGTGVFHPRVLNENVHFAPPAINTPFVNNRQVMRLNRSEIQNSSQRICVATANTNTNTNTNTTSFGRYQISSEMFLPKDWTY